MAKAHLKLCDDKRKRNETYRIALNKKFFNKDCFNENDYVKNDNGLIGFIKSRDNNQIVVSWNDNTYERIQLANINNYLHKITKKDYIQENSVNNDSFQDLSLIKEENSINDKENINDMQKKIAELEDKLNNKQKNQVKYNAAKELVSLAISKGILDENDEEIEILKILSFSEEDFNKYKEMLLTSVSSINADEEVSSLTDDDNENIDDGLSPEEKEAQQMLNKLRGGNRKKLSFANADGESRSLKNLSQQSFMSNKITYANTNGGTTLNAQQVTLDDGLMSMFADSSPSPSPQTDNFIRQASVTDNNFDEASFNNLSESNQAENLSLDEIFASSSPQPQQQQTNSFLKTPLNGITKPLLIASSSDNINPINNAFKELFSPDMWTSVGNGLPSSQFRKSRK